MKFQFLSARDISRESTIIEYFRAIIVAHARQYMVTSFFHSFVVFGL